jgi:hypothetical protein
VETQDTCEEYWDPLIFLFHFTSVTSATVSKQEKEDTEIQFGTSYLRLVGLPCGLEILSFTSFTSFLCRTRLMVGRMKDESHSPAACIAS